MLIKLDSHVAAHTKQDLIAQEQQRTQEYVTHQLMQQRLLEEDTLNPTIWEKQKGYSLTHAQLMDILLKLNPNFKYAPVLSIEGKAVPHVVRLIVDTPNFGFGIDPAMKQLCLVNTGEMPEYSFFSWTYEEIPDLDVIRGKRKIVRSELPASRLLYDPDTKDYKLEFDPNAAKPGYKKVRRPHHEKIRGWRTVLAHVVQAKLATPDQVEALIPTSSNRATWAQKMGRDATSEF